MRLRRSVIRKEVSSMNRRTEVLIWLLRCGHVIICDCAHYTGQMTYCSKCNAWTRTAKWENYTPEETP
jgi:hypothetical protein